MVEISNTKSARSTMNSAIATSQAERMYTSSDAVPAVTSAAEVKSSALLLIRTDEKAHAPNIKYEVMKRVSNSDRPSCASCGIDNLDLLTLNHINHDGGMHRHQMQNDKNEKNEKKEKIYSWLMDNDFPSYYLNSNGDPVKLELNVLCYNCNYIDAVNFYSDNKISRDKLELISIQTNGKNRCDECGISDIRVLNVYQYPNVYKWCKARGLNASKRRKGNKWKLSYVKENGPQKDMAVLCQNCYHKKARRLNARLRRSHDSLSKPRTYSTSITQAYHE